MAQWTEERRKAASEAAKNRKMNIHHVEDYDGEMVPEFQEKEEGLGWKMTPEERLQSVINTLRVLPYNMSLSGRQSLKNVQALNCFRVTEEMLDKIYSEYKHDDFGQLVRI